MSESNGWNEYKHLVLQELERIDDVVGKHLEKCDASIQDLKSFVVANKEQLLKEIIAIRDSINDKLELKISNLNDRLNKTENKVSNIYAVGVFCSVATGVIVGIVNIIVSNFW